MNKFFSCESGQASIEFILVLIFMLIVVTGIILPLGQRLQMALDDVSKIGSVSTGLKRLSGNFDAALATNGDSKQFLDFFLPKGTSLTCDPVAKTVSVDVPIHTPVYNLDGTEISECQPYNTPPADPAMICTKTYAVPTSVTFKCQGSLQNSFALEAGAAGFSQRLRVTANYGGSPPTYTINFSTV